MPIVYRGRVFSVEVEQAVFPNGRTHEVASVRHGPSVVVIPLERDGRVVLIRQYRHTIGREIWELPAGRVDPGEAAEAAAIRECEEETRLVPGSVERIRGLFPAPGFSDEELIFFRARDLAPAAPDSTRKPDDDEDIQVRVCTVNEAKEMVARGDIIDLKTAYGLTLI